ncbi:hypothetical protein AWB67_06014 [Caballeronia terrestris]|jgi:hypothetical protein|uniref:Uncharacterized protein n=1 Tax=Caballeronia terrestris TaxID=1226301 RepID=A0A158KM15_9BURK|nr:hypothetical protein AWB67_06014 [Caballeronia terrestris]
MKLGDPVPLPTHAAATHGFAYVVGGRAVFASHVAVASSDVNAKCQKGDCPVTQAFASQHRTAVLIGPPWHAGSDNAKNSAGC